MTSNEIRIAKRLVKEMRLVAMNAQKEGSVDPQGLAFFQGIGLTLAIVFEELTGKESKSLKPTEIMAWADNLPMPEKRDRLESIH
jgi:hypothetical protein